MIDDNAKSLILIRVLMAGCLLALPILYPAVMIIAQDFPYLPELSASSYFAPSNWPYFKPGLVLVAAAFILAYASIYASLFLREAKVRFVLYASAIAIAAYHLALLIAIEFFPTVLALQHYPCRSTPGV